MSVDNRRRSEEKEISLGAKKGWQEMSKSASNCEKADNGSSGPGHPFNLAPLARSHSNSALNRRMSDDQRMDLGPQHQLPNGGIFGAGLPFAFAGLPFASFPPPKPFNLFEKLTNPLLGSPEKPTLLTPPDENKSGNNCTMR
jgi:hypothetical protein